ncbi:hypothetical protein BDV95DRAFT_218682 [Massariosphaeria phaeospora]|uniref:Uncharacterized protein n=1 Tax=Massariosphaeria phaeospora TaxID=100035 RepID=A0A7C8IGP0_9PLEO|nr:hypothetical protein BDV95DRAFT_218682 [Massariosphaeria phaeospora]
MHSMLKYTCSSKPPRRMLADVRRPPPPGAGCSSSSSFYNLHKHPSAPSKRNPSLYPWKHCTEKLDGAIAYFAGFHSRVLELALKVRHDEGGGNRPVRTRCSNIPAQMSTPAFPWNTTSFSSAPGASRMKEMIPSPTSTQPPTDRLLSSNTRIEADDGIGFLLNQQTSVRRSVRSQRMTRSSSYWIETGRCGPSRRVVRDS